MTTKLQELFKNISVATDVIAVVDLRNAEAGTTYADEERTPCISLDFPYENEFNDSYLMCIGDYINEFLNDEWHSSEEDDSIDLDQSLFAHIAPPRDWDKYIDKKGEAFGITFKDKDRYVYIIPVKEDWTEIKNS